MCLKSVQDDCISNGLSAIKLSYVVGKTRHTGLRGEGVLKDKQRRIESIWISPNCKRGAKMDERQTTLDAFLL